MGILLALAPFLVFAVLDKPLGSSHALAAGALVSAVLVVRGALRRPRSFKILEVGTLVLFAALALYTAAHDDLSIIGVRLCVDAGLLVLVLASIAARDPFTLQYARERVTPEVAASAEFRAINYGLSAAWAAAFAVMVAAEAALLFVPGVPQDVGIGVVAGALVVAFAFSKWYPGHVRRG